MSRTTNGKLPAALLALGLFAFVGCVVSPQPSPPIDEPSFDADGLGITETATEDSLTMISFVAAPGTVDPAEGVVVVTNLETSDAPSIATVSDDGSFSIALNGLPTDVVRFQVKQGNVRSQPVDIAIDATAQGFDVIDGAPACLVVDPAKFVALSGQDDARSIILRNQCDSVVRIQPPRLRRGQGAFTFAPTGQLSIDPGAVSFVTVRVEGSAGETEDVLFLDVIEPEVSRRAITLAVPDP